MAEIPPIDDAYINEIIKANGPFNPALNKTQGIKLRELFKLMRDRFEQQISEDSIIIDTVPTNGSVNAVSSGGVFEALGRVNNFVRVLDIAETDLSGSGTLEQQIADYINQMDPPLVIVSEESKWNVRINKSSVLRPLYIYHIAEASLGPRRPSEMTVAYTQIPSISEMTQIFSDIEGQSAIQTSGAYSVLMIFFPTEQQIADDSYVPYSGWVKIENYFITDRYAV